MYEKSKDGIVCPICDASAKMFQRTHYVCDKCNWDSFNEDVVDISYSDPLSAPMSNLFPHEFYMPIKSNPYTSVKCCSMESFIQSLRVKDPELQRQICANYSGYMAYKMRLALGDWRKNGIVYWDGEPIIRFSPKYKELITTAYDALFDGNAVFREIILPSFKDKVLIHSIGCALQSETLLTEVEYRYQLKRLIEKYKQRHNIKEEG